MMRKLFLKLTPPQITLLVFLIFDSGDAVAFYFPDRDTENINQTQRTSAHSHGLFGFLFSLVLKSCAEIREQTPCFSVCSRVLIPMTVVFRLPPRPPLRPSVFPTAAHG
jgi:hypothetical protein